MNGDPTIAVESSWRLPKYLFFLWMCFLVKSVFYTVLFPMWEGYDEYSHFAFIQHLANGSDLPVPNTTQSREVDKSLQLVPLPWLLRTFEPPSLTHEDYWKLTPEERLERQAALRTIPLSFQTEPSPSHTLYEGQQGPLYYWLMSVPYRLVASHSLELRVFLLRLCNVLLASLMIPIAFKVAVRVLGSERMAPVVPALLVAMPELFVDVSRVGNQVLAMVLFSLLTWLCLEVVDGKPRYLPLAGSLLGLLLLTKAYGLAAVPAMIAVTVYSILRQPNTKTVVLAIVGVSMIPLLSGWWFLRNFGLTGGPIWIGGVPAKETGVWEILSAIPRVEWLNAFRSLFASHIWWGNWSFLSVRSWIYHVFEFAGLIVVCGIVVCIIQSLRTARRKADQAPTISSLLVVLAVYVGFIAAISHHILITYLDTGVGASCGWYIYAVVVPETILIVIGLSAFKWGKHLVLAAISMFLLLEMYATHWILVPYYTGLISHRPDGTLQALYPEYAGRIGFAELLDRLQVNRPQFLHDPWLVCLWVLYLLASFAVVYCAYHWLSAAGPTMNHNKPVNQANAT